jgi:tRNA A-37 threonylcarbamoyl transferase component Bud32
MSQGSPRPEHELSPGDVCDGYRILSLIAAGGMGDVYEAVHDPSGRTVAIKCLKVRHRNKEDARARMKMEAVVLSELQHENLVQVYDAGVTDAGMVWFAMERLHGQTLRDVLFRAGKLPIPDALHYASEIADGVDAVHEVNVIHRDLKPENVFVTDDIVVKVLDLGTGKFTGYGLNSTDRMRVIGTTAYMSPEQIKGLRVDARADVYALGLIVYEMIAGRHALAAESGAALPQGIEHVALMQLQMTPKPLADVAWGCPRYVSLIVDRAIAKDRERRFPNIAALARELRAARKRFVAENQFEGAGVPAAGEGLREKFGAPPRATPAPRPAVSAPPRPATNVQQEFALPADTAADLPLAQGDAFATEVQPAPEFTLDGSTPPPTYVPTVLLSSSSVPGLPPELGVRSDVTDRGPPPDEVRSRTTQTNPIGFVRVADALDDSLEVDFRQGSWIAFWRHPVIRRAAVTLGLGAVIGVPPAVLGVVWARYYRAPAAAPSAPARALASPRSPTAVAPLTSAVASAATQTPGDVATTVPAIQEMPRPGAPSGAKPVPRARPKSATVAAPTALADEGPRRWETKEAAAPPPMVELPPKTILPPSGL